MLRKILFVLVTFTSGVIAFAQAPLQPLTPGDKEIAFTSDTQAPMWVETLILKSNNNRNATKKLFQEIADRKPTSLFMLGDVVNLGYSSRQWKPMDQNLSILRNEGIIVEAALGNHEVMGQAGKGERKFQRRFPDHVKTGYVTIVDSVAVILLNSNFSTLSAVENAQQVNWYENKLKELDNDSSVQFIITGCHHSPYTNSKIVSSSVDVQQKFVPPFLASTKSRLFLTGHSHNFEHFKVKGKDFLVIGGGGGLHQPLKAADKCIPDLQQDFKPMFHYLSVKRKADRLVVTSNVLSNDFTAFKEGLRLNILKPVAIHGADVAAKEE